MSELRQDPVTRDWVIINPKRAARPHDHAAPGPCPLCPGNEALTPEPTDVLAAPGGGWFVRAVPNAFPALEADGAGGEAHELTPEGWHRMPGHGRHEVIIETPEHAASLASVSEAQMRLVLEMYVRRFRVLAADASIRQVTLFRNQGRRAGTSLAHPHAQIVAAPVVAPGTRWRLAEEQAFFEANGCCGVCHVLERELEGGVRIVHAGESFVTLAPYASRVPYHLQIVPRRHSPAFPEAEAAELDALAGHLRATIGALHGELGDPDYNLVVVTPPLDQVHRHASHWYIDVLPRLTIPAGFELGSRIVVNVQAPEQAAVELRARWGAGAS